jgi:hypothetical protein
MIISPISSHYTYNGDSAAFYKYSCNRQIFINADINIRIKCGGERIYLSVSCAFLRVVQRSCLCPYVGIRMCRTSVVVLATRLRAGRSEVQIQVGARRLDRLQDPSSHLFNGYRVFFPGGKAAGVYS